MIRILLLFAVSLGASAAPFDDASNARIRELAVTSVNGNTPRGLNQDPHFITIDPPQWYDAEQAAVSGYSWGSNPARIAVGGAFRGYSNGSPWAFGIATESISSPTSTAHLVNEMDIVSRNGNSVDSAKWGLNIIFFNRATGASGALESPIGANAFNKNAHALEVESLPRTAAGEYSGWNIFAHFGASAFDRTTDRAYASVVDLSDVTANEEVPVYVVVYRCGQARCGLKVSTLGLELWELIDTTPRLVRIL